MKLQLLLILGAISICLTSFCQEKKEDSFSQENRSQLNTNPVIVSLSDLELNGINSSSVPISISSDDIEKLRYFDFSTYRIYSKSQKIQLENGPVIEIYSIEKMISLGVKFDKEFINSKRDVDYSTVTHSIIPSVNIGFGKIAAEELH